MIGPSTAARRAATAAGAILLAISIAVPLVDAATFTDQIGRSLTFAAPPRRIVSLVPSVTETLFAIGGQDLLVGVTDFCDYPPAARAKPRVGGMLAPSLETIAALRPDLVVATPAGNREETFGQLERLKIPVYVVNPVRLQDVLDLTSRLGDLAGRDAAGSRLAASLGTRIRAVGARVAHRSRPRVLYVLWPDPLIVPGRGALVSELLDVAGGESVTADQSQDYPRMSLEAAIARSPEIIVLASHNSQQGAMAREQWEQFSRLPAVKAGRLYTADGNLMHRYGPRVVDGLEWLARHLHPEAYESQVGPPLTAAPARP
jgi:iron complex transport system substrate-binding protein